VIALPPLAPVTAWVLALLAVLILPAGRIEGTGVGLVAGGEATMVAAIGLAAAAGGLALGRRPALAGPLMAIGGILTGLVLLLRIRDGLVFEGSPWAVAAVIVAVVLLLWRAMEQIGSHGDPPGRVIVPVLFGGLLVYLWEVMCLGFDVPQVLLPAPSRIAASISENLYTLGQDFNQTFVKAVIPGYVMGCGAGFLVAVSIDRSPFLQRGLLPLGSLISAMPIVGLAPIMVMWFGFDWQSKAAVVVVMTFYPMMVKRSPGCRRPAPWSAT